MLYVDLLNLLALEGGAHGARVRAALDASGGCVSVVVGAGVSGVPLGGALCGVLSLQTFKGCVGWVTD